MSIQLHKIAQVFVDVAKKEDSCLSKLCGERLPDRGRQKGTSMLIRIERNGFIRRIPRRARGIELTVNPDWIPPLDRLFSLR